MATELGPTKLAYFDDMWALQSTSILLSLHQSEDGRSALILESTIFHPQGGGQPADTGSISNPSSGFKFVVEDVRLKDGLVYHYGFFESSQDGSESSFKEGEEVSLHVDAPRRDLNSRLHSAGHLLDICMQNVGLGYLEPGKGYHFSDGPFVEYKGVVPLDELQTKQKELEIEAAALISRGGKVLASVVPYDEAVNWCGGDLPSYISKSSTPRIVKLGNNPGCPCGGTHVADIADIKTLKVTQIRTKKGLTKVFYSIGL
ncbi:uncharacterized protein A4U43_C02F21010 [Asparagus officinalis]|uniref:Alanyl-transfer RNA synthetases family profile domain-containing protein n=1 Tax=Asparagus officinalis TaxID=4686 RepID=A0A5P1FNW2_ASPOF|nr:uncharacterized protein LOC109831806 isoform X1 [Asparagus officinalis]XP_020254835.1 uncharacterized protein LOC109831806 isoform X2 [Asparagus officinalis]ONK78649.1 uncharacterized protein A4U43_C02F21010 [Asparagus officinalis]